jgi:hypothetical protein
MTSAQLDDLFRNSPAGPIPDGVTDGTAIIASGIDLSGPVAKFAAVLWQGKIFDGNHGTLVNRIAGHHAVEATVYPGRSLLDDKQRIVLDYSHSTRSSNTCVTKSG